MRATAPHAPGEPACAPAPARAGVTIREDGETRWVRALASKIEGLYRERRRDVAAASSPTFPPSRATRRRTGSPWRAPFRERFAGTGRAGVVIERQPGSSGALAVAIPPGTYGSSPERQDLIFLQGAVLVLGTGERRAKVEVPVACGNYDVDNPSDRLGYGLRRLEPGSDIDRLVGRLCEGAPEAEAQLAIWIARNGISRRRLLAEGGGITFDSGVPVRIEHGEGAARLLREAGLDPSGTRWFSEPLPVRMDGRVPGDLRLIMGAEAG